MSLSEEVFDLYALHLEHARLFIWYSESKNSFHSNKANKVEAERNRVMSNFYFDKLKERIRRG